MSSDEHPRIPINEHSVRMWLAEQLAEAEQHVTDLRLRRMNSQTYKWASKSASLRDALAAFDAAVLY